ncbi:GIY-YIG catalytic domain-containing endonuclease [Paramecium bursaria Chlorella virus CZ-2]|nr:GIY-YIG catalytic domain-containing endonuclease [Paramecium bursaria Chlorella virus CZ-2]
MGFIYMLTFPSEKSYIGQSIRDIHKRLEEHQLPRSKCVAVYNAIQKYGWENVKIDWYECPDEDLNFDENLLVEEMGTLAPGGYNLMEGGGSKGRPSEESKQKMSDAQSGEKHHMFGKEHTEKSKQKMSGAKSGEKCYMFGKEHTEETKKKQSEANSGEKNSTSKKVYKYTLDGTYVDSYASGGEAARALGKTYGTWISACARGDRKDAYGFKWTRELL